VKSATSNKHQSSTEDTVSPITEHRIKLSI